MSTFLTNLLRSRLAAVADLEDKDIIAQYTHLRAFESDFDKAQSSLRTIASAWLLAAIGGVGLVTQNQFVGQTTLDPAIASVLRQALLLFAAFGLASLWYLDQRVYQSLLHSVFSLGCHLELATEKILPVRCRTYLLNLDITHALGMFYSIPLIVIFIASLLNFLQAFVGLRTTIGAFCTWSLPAIRPSQAWSLSLVFTAIHLVFIVFILATSRHWATLIDQLPEVLQNAPRQQRRSGRVRGRVPPETDQGVPPAA